MSGAESVFNELRIMRKFCDAVIKVEDVEFQVHKIILCNCSPCFRALFERWSAPQRTVFKIPGLSPEVMQLIIEFAYTGSVSVTEKNVKDLLVAAKQFSITEIVQECLCFLERHLRAENCIGFWKVAKVCHYSKMQLKAYHHILDRFEDVVACDEFLQLSVQELTQILERDDLIVKKESSVFEAILHWIAHAPEEREEHIAVLFSKVRLALMSEEYIREKVMTSRLVKDNSECLPTIANANQTLNCIRNSPHVTGICYSLARPRLPPAILLAIGGWTGKKLSKSIEVYDVRADNWVNMANNLKHPIAYTGAAFLNGYVYCIGGFNGIKNFNTVFRFDLSTRTWHEVAPMHEYRRSLSVTVLNGCIYAAGGHNGIHDLRSAEVYRPETNQWSLIASMRDARKHANCATFQKRIYICGGFGWRNYLQTAEYYSPETDQWTMIAPMISPRSGLAVVAHNNRIYAIGGSLGNTRLSSVESYNPRTNSWRAVSPMLFPRGYFGCAVVDNRLFVVGGFSNSATFPNVEYYDPTDDVWSAACDMETPRSGLSCCVVPTLPNMADCTVPRDAMAVLNL